MMTSGDERKMYLRQIFEVDGGRKTPKRLYFLLYLQ